MQKVTFSLLDKSLKKKRLFKTFRIGPTEGKRKFQTRVGIEPMTSGFGHRRSTDWATRSDHSRSWEMKMLMHGNEYVEVHILHIHCRAVWWE